MKRRRRSVLIAIVSVLALAVIFSLERMSPAQSGITTGASVYGRVMSIYGPVENARVRVAGGERYVLTDRQGRFLLQADHMPGRRAYVTAGKPGWFNNGRMMIISSGRPEEIFLNPVYLADRTDYQFISPVTCSGCHGELTRYWDQSKMAHTTSNPVVYDMYYGTDFYRRPGIGPGYRLDNPRSNGNCVTCHAPSAAASSPWSLDLRTALSLPSTEWDGISCDYCHKVRDVLPDKSKPSGMAAVLERQSSPTNPAILVFGPYDDVVVPPMAASYNPLFGQGRYCSTCHSQYENLGKGKGWDRGTIYSDAQWAGFGFKEDTILPVQTTYQEWKEWQEQLPSGDPNKGKKCQDCHMSWQKKMLPYGNYVVDGMARRMWGTYREAQNIHPHQFEGGTETQLKNALAMEVDGEVTGKKLAVSVYVTNTNGGHWIPTGDPMRSVMLLVDVHSSSGKPLKMSKGSRLPEWTGSGGTEEGDYAGRTGAVFARVLGDDQGNVHVPFWKATRVVSDNRLRAKSTRTLEFEFVLDNPGDQPTVEAKLIYRQIIRPLVKKKNWPIKDILIATSVW